jgi:hypothetical protein
MLFSRAEDFADKVDLIGRLPAGLPGQVATTDPRTALGAGVLEPALGQ